MAAIRCRGRAGGEQEGERRESPGPGGHQQLCSPRPPFREGGVGGGPHPIWQAPRVWARELSCLRLLQERGLGGCDESCQCWRPVPASRARWLPGHLGKTALNRGVQGLPGGGGGGGRGRTGGTQQPLCGPDPRWPELLPGRGSVPVLSPHTWTLNTVTPPTHCPSPPPSPSLRARH